mmetsp:Transcript_29229/g.52219  ORF Transcript_29229/g.52219 Transcript_29229/m.52219 type:complete len:240 (-) Transcript_29229:3609-4328(-)
MLLSSKTKTLLTSEPPPLTWLAVSLSSTKELSFSSWLANGLCWEISTFSMIEEPSELTSSILLWPRNGLVAERGITSLFKKGFVAERAMNDGLNGLDSEIFSSSLASPSCCEYSMCSVDVLKLTDVSMIKLSLSTSINSGNSSASPSSFSSTSSSSFSSSPSEPESELSSSSDSSSTSLTTSIIASCFSFRLVMSVSCTFTTLGISSSRARATYFLMFLSFSSRDIALEKRSITCKIFS